MKEIQSINKDTHKHLMDRHPETWSRAFFSTARAYDAVKNGISECFNALIVDARRKPIINMLEDIRVLCMERYQKMREKHIKWNDDICPNLRKKLELNWKVIPSGESSVGKVSARGEIVFASGRNMSASGDIISASGGNVTASGGNLSTRGGKVSARGGKVTVRGGKVTTRGGKVTARGGKVSASPSTPHNVSSQTEMCTPPPGFKMYIPKSSSSAVRTSGGVRMRGGAHTSLLDTNDLVIAVCLLSGYVYEVLDIYDSSYGVFFIGIPDINRSVTIRAHPMQSIETIYSN
ncbi:hypothetical protein Tco_0669248 [Tanacetum coccineum]